MLRGHDIIIICV